MMSEDYMIIYHNGYDKGYADGSLSVTVEIIDAFVKAIIDSSDNKNVDVRTVKKIAKNFKGEV